jgi:hypothetical protein
MEATVYGVYIERIFKFVKHKKGNCGLSVLEDVLAEDYKNMKFTGLNRYSVDIFDHVLDLAAEICKNGDSKEKIWQDAGTYTYRKLLEEQVNHGKKSIKELLNKEIEDFPKHHNQGRLNVEEGHNGFIIKILDFPMSEAYRNFAVGYLKELGNSCDLKNCKVEAQRGTESNTNRFNMTWEKKKGD